jgi:3-hydroxy-9,10-secoandrosta-1,3,5(10)-triene-9,17-dione monooxygenase reductase component
MMDRTMLRKLFGSFATGVTVVTAIGSDGRPVGITVNSFTSVSLDPPLLLWCLANKSASLGAFVVGASFAVHVLAADQAEVAGRFARSGIDKFAGQGIARDPASAPEVPGALARLDCRVVRLDPGGDHTIILAEMLSAQMRSGAPLVFHASRFGRFAIDEGPATGSADPWT